MSTVNVGPAADLKTGIDWIKAATAKHLAGDDSMAVNGTVKYDPGNYNKPNNYTNDTIWVPPFAKGLVFDGSGPEGAKSLIVNAPASGIGMPNVKGLPLTGKMGDKGMIVIGDGAEDTTIRGFEVLWARTLGGSNNGAAIRLDRAKNLTVEDFIAMHCQNGILISPDVDDPATETDERGNVTLRRALLESCGFGGQAHLLYCGPVASLLAEESQFLNAIGEGNTFKTRADSNTVTYCTLSTGSGYNSWLYDAEGGYNKLWFNAFQHNPAYSSQPKNGVHIYIWPQSKPVQLDIQWNVFDMRGKFQGHPILVDPRVTYKGTGAVGLDGQFHKLNANYYLPQTMPDALRDITGIVDNNTVLINADQLNHFGFDPATGKNRMCFTPNDAAYRSE